MRKLTNKFLTVSLVLGAGALIGCTSLVGDAKQPAKPDDNTANKKVAVKPTAPENGNKEAAPPIEAKTDNGGVTGKCDIAPSAKSGEQNGITAASYNKIETGMTLAQIEKIVGEAGMKVSEMKVNGRETEIYKWASSDFGKYIDVTFEHGKAIEKKQKGLL
jgi:hypothetical protein